MSARIARCQVADGGVAEVVDAVEAAFAGRREYGYGR
jgi:hypothetical protein